MTIDLRIPHQTERYPFHRGGQPLACPKHSEPSPVHSRERIPSQWVQQPQTVLDKIWHLTPGPASQRITSCRGPGNGGASCRRRLLDIGITLVKSGVVVDTGGGCSIYTPILSMSSSLSLLSLVHRSINAIYLYLFSALSTYSVGSAQMTTSLGSRVECREMQGKDCRRCCVRGVVEA